MAIKNKYRNGFTLIEMIVSISVMSIVLVMGSNMFFSILKGTSKAEVEKEVKQNGDYAMNVMTRMIRNAKSIINCNSSQITILNLDSQPTVFSFISPTGDPWIASNSSSLISSNVTLLTGSASFTCGVTSPPEVTIMYTLIQKTTSTRPEEKAQIPFQSSVSLRNY